MKSKILIVVFILIFGLLFLRLIQLQVVEGKKYQQMAIENAAKIVPEPASRGMIYDCSGEVLVGNQPIFSVQVMPSLLSGDTAKRKAVLEKLGDLLGEKIDFKFSASQPIIVKDDVGLEMAIRVEELKRELPGVLVNTQPIRFYPHTNTASHLLGYIGEIEVEELKRLKSDGYRRGDILGKDGIEKYYDKDIRGVDGGKRIEVDVSGSPIRLLGSLAAVPGADVTLTVDLNLQLAAEKALGEKEGAVVVLNPLTGEILALVSHPNYDPNFFIGARDNAEWEALSRRRHPFMNRALAIYPPGSIFKVVTLTAALNEGLAKPDETLYCPGFYRINNRIAKCWKESGHGRITVQEGLVQSCDIVFYELGRRLGPARLSKYARQFGLGEKTGIDLPQEKKGLVPNEEWKKEFVKEPWYEGDSINYGIGQGFLQVTPLQMAAIYGMIASGKRMKPYVVAEIKNRAGEILYKAEPKEMGGIPLSNENLEIIRKALADVVSRGTGRAAQVEGMSVAGKTGTAENPGNPHAWFLCYAPAEDPKIVIAAFVAHGGEGSSAAAPIAREILKAFDSGR